MNDDPKRMFENTPPEPSTDGWADKARRRAGRAGAAWRAGFVTISVAAVISVALATSSLWSGPIVAATPTTESTPAATENGRPGPTEQSPDPAPTPTGACESLKPGGTVAGDVPLGASEATMCGAYANGIAFRAPVRGLTANVDEIAKWIDSRPRFDPQSPCQSDLGPAYNMVFKYPDGRSVVVTVELYGCAVINAGAQVHTGGRELTELLRSRWLEQRKHTAPAVERPGSWCPDETYGSSSFLSPELSNLTSGRVCKGGGYPQKYAETRLAASDFATLKADLDRNVRPDEMSDHGFDKLLVLADGHGDLLFIGKSLTTGTYGFTTGSGAYTWTPGADAAKVLQRVLGTDSAGPGQTEPSPDPAPTPAGACESLKPGGLVAGIPRGASEATMCGAYAHGLAFRAPVRGLTANLDDLAKWIDSRPKFDSQSPCTEELGPAYNLVFKYPGGRSVVVTVELFGCRTITTGAQIRTGGTELTELLRTLWLQQRGQTTSTPARPGSWCPDETYGASSFLSPELSTLQSGRVCKGEGYPQKYAETTLAASDFATLKADLSQNFRADETATHSDGTLLVLADGEGDLLFIGKSFTSDTYSFTTDSKTYTWTPGAEAAKVLQRVLG